MIRISRVLLIHGLVHALLAALLVVVGSDEAVAAPLAASTQGQGQAASAPRGEGVASGLEWLTPDLEAHEDARLESPAVSYDGSRVLLTRTSPGDEDRQDLVLSRRDGALSLVSGEDQAIARYGAGQYDLDG